MQHVFWDRGSNIHCIPASHIKHAIATTPDTWNTIWKWAEQIPTSCTSFRTPCQLGNLSGAVVRQVSLSTTMQAAMFICRWYRNTHLQHWQLTERECKRAVGSCHTHPEYSKMYTPYMCVRAYFYMVGTSTERSDSASRKLFHGDYCDGITRSISYLLCSLHCANKSERWIQHNTIRTVTSCCNHHHCAVDSCADRHTIESRPGHTGPYYYLRW
jgi:hypothetical protein